LALSERDGEFLVDLPSYRQRVGKLIYLTITKPDLAYVVHLLSHFMDKPRQPHLDAAHRVLWYLKQSQVRRSSYQQLVISNYMLSSDAYWACCKDI
jgi:hypothetical protein